MNKSMKREVKYNSFNKELKKDLKDPEFKKQFDKEGKKLEKRYNKLQANPKVKEFGECL